jgi:hypothetical protein
MQTIRKSFPFIFALLVSVSAATAQSPIEIPDIPDYKTLKCDFHIHSVFSDGAVWPTVRVDEAVSEGLDAISLTEHIEYRPHHASGDVTSTHGRSHDIAAPAAEKQDVLLIRGSEITRPMAPGHANAIFLTDSYALDVKDWRASYAEAKRQGAFIFWNHPGWERQQPDETLWWPEHTELYENGMLHGIEVVNGRGYSPEAHRWCIDKNLTMIGSTDIHAPIGTSYNFAAGRHRTMTLVFARERTPEAIREALDARRTVVFFDKLLIGDATLLKALFESAVEIVKVTRAERRVTVEFRNNSDLEFELRKTGHDPRIDYMHTGTMTVAPRQSGTFVVRFPEELRGKVNFEVTNMLTAPGKGLDVSYDL